MVLYMNKFLSILRNYGTFEQSKLRDVVQLVEQNFTSVAQDVFQSKYKEYYSLFVVEKKMKKKFRIRSHKRRNVPYRQSTYKIQGDHRYP